MFIDTRVASKVKVEVCDCCVNVEENVCMTLCMREIYARTGCVTEMKKRYVTNKVYCL